MKVNFYLPLLFYAFLISCGVPQEEYDKLKKENELLKEKVEDCQLEAPELLEKASLLYELIDYKRSKQLLAFLDHKYPDTEENEKGKELLVKVEKKLQLTQKALEVDELVKNSNAILGQMRKKVVKGVTFYTDKSSSRDPESNSLHLYAGNTESSKPWIGIGINRFSTKEWLHIQKVMINADGTVFNIEEERPDEFKEKKELKGYREWVDRALQKEEVESIKLIADSDEAILTLIGKEISEKRTITTAEKKAMQRIIKVYEILGGTI